MAKIHVTLSQVCKATLTHNLFANVSFQLVERDRIAIIGPNGSGKSTFLKIVAGLVQPDSGQVSRQRMMKIAYVTQDVIFTEERTVLTEVMLAARAGGADEDTAEVRAHVMLDKIGFTDSAQCVTALSGGWKKRLQIACALVDEPDVLLLDEPTNHLDFAGVLWLENFLSETTITWVSVTHDRYFLNRISKKIIEISDMYEGGFFSTDGDYETFQRLRDEYFAAQINAKNALTTKLRVEEAWLNAGVKARTTKARYRVEHTKELQLRLGEISQRLKQGSTFLKFTEHGLKSKDLVELSAISKKYDNKTIIEDFSCVVRRREIIGVLGANGSGKTTLLKIMGRLLAPDSGEVRQANDLEVLYFDQVRAAMQADLPLKRFLTDYGDRVLYQDQSIHINAWIRRFRFAFEHLEVPVNQLSGGEKARALIAKLIQQKADLLLLDEPTNDLDIATLEVLEESLMEFQGAIVIVTHDRYMLERIADYFIGVTGQGKLRFYADYHQWQREIQAETSDMLKKDAPKKEREAPAARVKSGRLAYMEQREFEAMESKILLAEGKVDELRLATDQLATSNDPLKLKEVCTALEVAQAEVEKLYQRWSELEDKMKT